METLVDNRSAAWQPRELEELLQGIQEHYEVLFGKLSANLSRTDKDRTWSEIVQTINCVGGNERNVDDTMKKWCDWKSRTIMKDGKRRRFMESSGEAALPKKLHLSVLEEKLLSLVPKSRLIGVPGGGVDTGPLERPMHETDTQDQGDANKRPKPNVPSEPVPDSTPSTSKSTASTHASNQRKTAMKGRSNFHQSHYVTKHCNCHQEMLDISWRMLEESIKRNEILREISSSLKLTAGKTYLDSLLDQTNF